MRCYERWGEVVFFLLCFFFNLIHLFYLKSLLPENKLTKYKIHVFFVNTDKEDMRLK